MDELAVLNELRLQYRGAALLPDSWFEAVRAGRAGFSRPRGYPRSHATLIRHLERLERWQRIARIPVGDGRCWYALADVWRTVPAETKERIGRELPRAHGPRGSVPLLLLGPSSLPPSLRRRLWRPVHDRRSAHGGLRFELRLVSAGKRRIDPVRSSPLGWRLSPDTPYVVLEVVPGVEPSVPIDRWIKRDPRQAPRHPVAGRSGQGSASGVTVPGSGGPSVAPTVQVPGIPRRSRELPQTRPPYEPAPPPVDPGPTGPPEPARPGLTPAGALRT